VIITADARAMPLESRSVHLIVTSPPYLALRDYGLPGEIGQESSPTAYVAELMTVLDECARVLTPDGSAFLVIGDKYARRGGVDRKERGSAAGDPGGRSHARLPQRGLPGVPDGSLAGLPFRVALAAIDRGWIWRQEIVWHKPNPLPESVRNRCQRSHETILHLTRKSSGYLTTEASGHDVWEYPVGQYRDAQGRRHPAVFPERLVERIMRGWSNLGDTVLDPFAGSGTTVVVAERLGRLGIGVELNPDWAAVAQDRLDINSGAPLEWTA
jgi:DNA modification methylase